MRCYKSLNTRVAWCRRTSRYESGLWTVQEARYDAGKRECRGVLKALKKFRFWLYGVRFTIEIDANTPVAQLNQSATDLPGALVTRWLAWIRLFDFEVRHVPGTKHSAADGLSRRPRGSAEKEEDTDELDIDDFIDMELNPIYVCPVAVAVDTSGKVPDSGYSERSQQIARYLMTMARPSEVPSGKEFRLFRHQAMKFLVKDRHPFRRASKNVPLRRVIIFQQSESGNSAQSYTAPPVTPIRFPSVDGYPHDHGPGAPGNLDFTPVNITPINSPLHTQRNFARNDEGGKQEDEKLSGFTEFIMGFMDLVKGGSNK